MAEKAGKGERSLFKYLITITSTGNLMQNTQELDLFLSLIYLKAKTPPMWKSFILGSANSWSALCGLYPYVI